MRLISVAILLLGFVVTAHADDAAPSSATPRHLLAGVRAFKDARYEDALVELRVVAAAPDAPRDLAFYLGPTLYKLGRYREALGVFLTSSAERDALTDFYLGETYYRLMLFRKARGVFAGLRSHGLGPALDEAARRYIDAVDLAYRKRPEAATVDSYFDSGRALLAHEPAIAAEYLDEAREVDSLSGSHRHVEVLVALATAWNATRRPQLVVDLLAPETALSNEGTWQLARAYVEVGDGPHARTMLTTLSKTGGPHTDDAKALLAKLPP